MNASAAVSEDDEGDALFSRQRQNRSRRAIRSTCACSACSAICRCSRSKATIRARRRLRRRVTAGSFVTYPEIERIVICEIEPLIPAKVSRVFQRAELRRGEGPAGRDRLRRRSSLRPHLQGTIRHHHQRPRFTHGSRARPRSIRGNIRARKAGTSSPGGVVTHWVPLDETTIEAVKSEMATFFAVFPEWRSFGSMTAKAPATWCCSAGDPAPINVDEVVERFDRADNARAAKSLREIGFASAIDLLSTMPGAPRSCAVAQGRRHRHGSRPALAIPARNGPSTSTPRKR